MVQVMVLLSGEKVTVWSRGPDVLDMMAAVVGGADTWKVT